MATGVATGLVATGLLARLFAVEGLAYGPRRPDYQAAVTHASGAHRVITLLVAGAIGGVAWWAVSPATWWAGGFTSPPRRYGC